MPPFDTNFFDDVLDQSKRVIGDFTGDPFSSLLGRPENLPDPFSFAPTQPAPNFFEEPIAPAFFRNPFMNLIRPPGIPGIQQGMERVGQTAVGNRRNDGSVVPITWTGDEQAALAQIGELASTLLGSPEAAKVVQAIVKLENGLTGLVGDVAGGGSYGPFQFYAAGQLPAFAKWLGVDVNTAKQKARDIGLATKFALETYLGDAIKAGMNRGLTGAELAAFAQRFGQRSQNPDKVKDIYNQLFGNGSGPIQVAPSAAQNAAGQIIPSADKTWKIAFDFDQPYSNPFNKNIPRHRGVDIVIADAPNGGMGQSYKAFNSGQVVAAGWMGKDSGYGIIIKGDDGLYHRYFHNASINVKAGDYVNQNTVLGVVGDSGTEGFPHLHYEVSRNPNGDPMGSLIDPRPYIRGLKR